MKILTTLFPVFFMMALGFVSRIKKWLTPDQKEGAKKLVFGILFPVLIFNAIFTSSLSASTGIVILYVTAAFLAVYLLGRLLLKNSKDQYDELIPFLLTTCEGGNVALPLYTTIVGAGYAINTVTFDMAGVILAFVIVPAIVTARTSGSADMKSMLKKICTNSFVVSSILGLVMNLTGMYHILEQSAFLELYTGTVSMILAPIAGVILFTIGYDLNADTAHDPADHEDLRSSHSERHSDYSGLLSALPFPAGRQDLPDSRYSVFHESDRICPADAAAAAVPG